MTYLVLKQLFSILLAGVICWIFTLSQYMERTKSLFFYTNASIITNASINTNASMDLQTPTEDDVARLNLCIWHCENPKITEGVQPNYRLPTKFSESTCGAEATSRGPHQRVVGYSFYGSTESTRSYFQGIERNVLLMQELYPGWVMRVYHNIKEPWARHLLCQMQCNHWEVLDTCFIENLPGYGNITGSQGNAWRFLAVSDPLVDMVLARDLDSNLNVREQAAVQEWIQSNASMHVMRDSRYHDIPMLAGMWGARMNDSNRIIWRDMIESLLTRGKVGGGHENDQKFLAEEVWIHRPSDFGFVLQHDSYYCEKYKPYGRVLPFPTQRQHGPLNYVGSRFNLDNNPQLLECPAACRKQPDWRFC